MRGPSRVPSTMRTTQMKSWIAKAALPALAACVLAGAIAPGALAQESAGVEQLSGTLKKIKTTRTVVIGYRDASVPFSYLSAARQPIGYSIDICTEIVEAIRGELGDDTIQVKYMAVDTQTRIPRVVDGTNDLECRTYTDYPQPRQQVALSSLSLARWT